MANGKGFFLGALVGSVLGGVTALLFAPKSGEKLRRDINKQYQQTSEKTHEIIDRVGHKAQQFAKNFTEQASDLVDKAKDLADKARDVADDVACEIKARRKRK